MTRLSHELQRLGFAADADAATTGGLCDAAGRARALVLDLRAPADWSALARVWQGVQTDLDLPAPGIVVSGSDGVQLWFALQQPVDAADAAAWLQALVQRWLADVPAHRLRLCPDAAGTPGWQPAAVPALQGEGGDGERWSAFVAPDLAPMFSDTPWLDMPPNPDGQAALLARLQPIEAQAFQRTLLALQPADAPRGAGADAPQGAGAGAPQGAVADPAAAPADPQPSGRRDQPPAGGFGDPRQFLLAVMNDGAVPMALRIEAAKALLPGR